MKTLLGAALLSLSAFSASASPELVMNGDFETGNFAGWTKSGNPRLSDVSYHAGAAHPSYVWSSGATRSAAYISQDVHTVANGAYTLSFDLYTNGTWNATFEAYFGDARVMGTANVVLDWIHFTFTDLVATSSLTGLRFGSRNDPGFHRLDNVSLVRNIDQAAPEPGSVVLIACALIALAGVRRSRH